MLACCPDECITQNYRAGCVRVVLYRLLDSITHRWGELELADIEAGTDWLLKHAWADRKRVYATGGSYGGYMVAWMNGHTDRYQAMICHAGVYNWHSMMASDVVRSRERPLGALPTLIVVTTLFVAGSIRIRSLPVGTSRSLRADARSTVTSGSVVERIEAAGMMPGKKPASAAPSRKRIA